MVKLVQTASVIYGHHDSSTKVTDLADKQSLKFLEELTNSFGPAGFEREPTRMVRDYVKKYSDSISTDQLGSLLFSKKGRSDRPTILIPGHVDEVGFIVSSVNKLGYLTFNPLGGWFDQVLLGQRVKIRTAKGLISGIIAAKPPHLLPQEERSKVVTKDKMFIDIGASNEEEAKAMGVRIGNPVMPDSLFSTMTKRVFRDGKRKGSDTIAIGKAFDDRIGTFVAAEVVRRLKERRISHPNTVVGAATTQEEVGLRGARTTAFVVKPDVCLTVEVDIAGDVPGIEANEAPSKMGLGPSITTFDSSMIPNQELLEFVVSTAERAKIPHQLSQIARGGTDAGIIHISSAGCPSLVIGVPTRHIHAHAGMLSLTDAENAIRLIVEVVKELDKKKAESFTAI
ncbi:MAG: M42 family metallopeptidase [Methanobacteriota archaeon]|nr:MAG: M42 family metallopeptidase [Euryarchaeota archaeon]